MADQQPYGLVNIGAPWFGGVPWPVPDLPVVTTNRLDVGCLYILISIPLPIFIGAEDYSYSTDIPEGVDPACYEAGVEYGDFAEEFHWDIYWHNKERSGILYRLQTIQKLPPRYIYDRLENVNIRNLSQVVGLVRVLKVPRELIDLATYYIDYMSEYVAQAARRSFLWAMKVYHHIRYALVRVMRAEDATRNQLTLGAYAAHIVRFAYQAAPTALVDLKPRPVITSPLAVTFCYVP